MSTLGQSFNSMPHLGPSALPVDQAAWYAIHVRSRHEYRVAQDLQERNICTFLPSVHSIRRWSDRKVKIEVPLFTCYAFVRTAQEPEERLRILQTQGVLGFVGNERKGTPIPDHEVESLQKAIHSKIPCAVHPFISVGQRVRVRGGSLDGMKGILMGSDGKQSVVLSVELLRQSVSIQIEGYEIELA